MASQNKHHPLPKFGEWDVNNPASANGFTVIFNKARDEKRTTGAGNIVSQQRNDNHVYRQNEAYHQQHPPKKRWFCCGW